MVQEPAGSLVWTGFRAQPWAFRKRENAVVHARKRLCQGFAQRVLHDVVLKQARPSDRRQKMRRGQ